MQIFHEERNIILEYKISWLFWFWQKCIMHNIESIKEYFVSTIQPYKDKTLLVFKAGLLPGCWKEGKNLSDLKSIRGEWGGGEMADRHKERQEIEDKYFSWTRVQAKYKSSHSNKYFHRSVNNPDMVATVSKTI